MLSISTAGTHLPPPYHSSLAGSEVPAVADAGQQLRASFWGSRSARQGSAGGDGSAEPRAEPKPWAAQVAPFCADRAVWWARLSLSLC